MRVMSRIDIVVLMVNMVFPFGTFLKGRLTDPHRVIIYKYQVFTFNLR
jgi:hypothetical protein